MTDLKAQALALYKPPFKHIHGYIWDSDNHMVADDGGMMRVRGWGRIQKQPDAEKLQDTVGDLIADALTKYWNKSSVEGAA